MDTDRGNTHKGALFHIYSGHPENSGSDSWIRGSGRRGKRRANKLHQNPMICRIRTLSCCDAIVFLRVQYWVAY